jgi:hypothetical protein
VTTPAGDMTPHGSIKYSVNWDITITNNGIEHKFRSLAVSSTLGSGVTNPILRNAGVVYRRGLGHADRREGVVHGR